MSQIIAHRMLEQRMKKSNWKTFWRTLEYIHDLWFLWKPTYGKGQEWLLDFGKNLKIKFIKLSTSQLEWKTQCILEVNQQKTRKIIMNV